MDRPAGILLLVLSILLGNQFLSVAQEPAGEYQVFPKIRVTGEQKPVLPQDRFIAPDKAQHFMGSLISTVFFCKVFETHTDVSPAGSKYLGSGITLGLGVSKEILDSTEQNNRFSWKDLIADITGIAVGLIIINQP